jgi:hypothetical protein
MLCPVGGSRLPVHARPYWTIDFWSAFSLVLQGQVYPCLLWVPLTFKNSVISPVPGMQQIFSTWSNWALGKSSEFFLIFLSLHRSLPLTLLILYSCPLFPQSPQGWAISLRLEPRWTHMWERVSCHFKVGKSSSEFPPWHQKSTPLINGDVGLTKN